MDNNDYEITINCREGSEYACDDYPIVSKGHGYLLFVQSDDGVQVVRHGKLSAGAFGAAIAKESPSFAIKMTMGISAALAVQETKDNKEEGEPV